MLFSNQLPCYLSNKHLRKVFCCSPMPVHRFFRKRDEKHSFRVLPPAFYLPFHALALCIILITTTTTILNCLLLKDVHHAELTQLLQQQIQLSLLVSCLLCFVPTYHPNNTQMLQAAHLKYYILLLPLAPPSLIKFSFYLHLLPGLLQYPSNWPTYT